MKAPTIDYIRDFTGEPFVAFDDAFLKAFFSKKFSAPAVNRWHTDPTIFSGSRLGLAGFWELCLEWWDLHPAHFAAVSSTLWQHGRRNHAIVECGVGTPEELIKAMLPFAGSDIIMNAADREAFAQMPDPIRAYRGGNDIAELEDGFSWTTERPVAESFAARCKSGAVRERLIAKVEVIAYFGDGERELVVETR